MVVGLIGFVRKGSMTKWKAGFGVVAFVRLSRGARMTVLVVDFWIGIG